jgi:hypothetical protein
MNSKYLLDPELHQQCKEDWSTTENLMLQEDAFDRLHRCLAQSVALVRAYTFCRITKDRKFRMKTEADLVTLQATLQADPTDTITQTTLLEVEATLDDIKLQIARQAQETLRLNWISDGDSCSKRFFSLFRARTTASTISKIADPAGHLMSYPIQIAKLATDYYKFHLNDNHILECTTTQADREYILSTLSDRIGTSQALALDEEILLQEVQNAIKKMSRGHTPGPDGIPVEFYSTFPFVLPLLTTVYNVAWQRGYCPAEFLLGDIVPLPKKGDPFQMVNNRPITLLNTKYKIFATVWQL